MPKEPHPLKILYCWRCQMDVPMLDEAEWAPVEAFLMCEVTRNMNRQALDEYERVTGYRETNPAALWHHRILVYGPPCTHCGKPLRTRQAKLCAACGEPRAGYPPSDASRLLEAAQFAATKHRDQRRKDVDASPYINHPIAVAELLARVGGVTDITVLLAAVLHDTVEDTKTSFGELYALFGEAVRGIVVEVTDDKTLPKEERKRRQIAHAANGSHAAKLVKLADKICNVSDVIEHPAEGWSVERRLEYITWAERVIAGCRGTNVALEQHFDELVSRGKAMLGAGAPDTTEGAM